jgi:hypothetical protein
MGNRVRIASLLLPLALLGLAGAWADEPGAGAKSSTRFPRHILLIRHAEKTGEKEDIHLAKQGKERADILDRLFIPSKDRPEPFPTPDFIFAAAAHKESRRRRRRKAWPNCGRSSSARQSSSGKRC